jgi:hypothetical protein
MYRFSHKRPSVAVCFFSLSSFRTRSWRVSERAGAASCRSRIFYILLAFHSLTFSYQRFSYLDVANHVVLDRLESRRAQDIYNRQLWISRMVLVNLPKSVDRLSAASRNSVVEMALSFEASTGTSTKLLLTVSKKVPPGGYAAAIVIVCWCL